MIKQASPGVYDVSFHATWEEFPYEGDIHYEALLEGQVLFSGGTNPGFLVVSDSRGVEEMRLPLPDLALDRVPSSLEMNLVKRGEMFRDEFSERVRISEIKRAAKSTLSLTIYLNENPGDETAQKTVRRHSV